MTKIYILLLFLVPLFSPFSFGITQPKHSVNVLSIIKDSGFTGVWKNEKDHIIIIWTDENEEYNFLLMSSISRNVSKTLTVDLIGNSLFVETIFYGNNYKTKNIFTLINNSTMNNDFINQDGTQYNSKWTRVL